MLPTACLPAPGSAMSQPKTELLYATLHHRAQELHSMIMVVSRAMQQYEESVLSTIWQRCAGLVPQTLSNQAVELERQRLEFAARMIVNQFRTAHYMKITEASMAIGLITNAILGMQMQDFLGTTNDTHFDAMGKQLALLVLSNTRHINLKYFVIPFICVAWNFDQAHFVLSY